MSVFIPYLLCLALVVGIVCGVAIQRSRRGPKSMRDEARRERARRDRLEREQERFYRQQSSRFWRDLFRGR